MVGFTIEISYGTQPYERQTVTKITLANLPGMSENHREKFLFRLAGLRT